MKSCYYLRLKLLNCFACFLSKENLQRDFEELSSEVVKYADGLPLALKVLGSSVCGQNKEQWRDIIDRLKKTPNDDILGKLKIGLDGLNKDEMRIFLDIACLYNPETRYYVERILKSCGIHMIGISCLSEKCLLSISEYDFRFQMHNLIKEMGENVLRKEYANSRIWLPEEVHDLFTGKLKTKKVESLRIPEGYRFEDYHVNRSKLFKRMQSLQVSIVDYGTICSESTVTCLPSSLRWIEWLNYPSISLPEEFEPSHLVSLTLYKSQLVELWPISKKLSNLKHLDLSCSLGLTKTPNFGNVPNLETLSLWGCENLEEVHPSLGYCRMLTSLNLNGCAKLKKFPKFVSSLETLDLEECTSLEDFPEICGDMRRLSRLRVGSPWIRSLPPSLSGLSYLELRGCNKLATLPNSLFESQQLKILYMDNCSRLIELPMSLGVQKKLVHLLLKECKNLKKLQSSIQMESLENSRYLIAQKVDTFPEINGDMHSLTKLTTGIRELPSSIGNMRGLTELYLEGCEDLVSLPNNLCNLKNLQRLYLCGCKKLEKLPENIGDLQELWLLRFSNERQFQHSSSFVLYQVSGLSSLKYLYLCNLNLLGGLPEDLGSLQYLEHLDVRGSNISCLPKSIKELLWLKTLDVKFCLNLNELPGKLPPNLEELYADYHLALKSIRDLVNKCLKLRMLSISWFGHEKSECGTVSSEQVNVFLQHFLRTCIQCDFHQRVVFLISCSKVRISDLFDYQFINLKEISIELNPSWYTGKFMGFSICCCSSEADVSLVATLLCKSDPVRKHSLMYVIRDYYSEFPSAMCFIYIPFKTLWHASDNKKGKKPNDYCLFEASIKYGKEACWGIRLEYENKVRRWRRKQRATQSPKLVPVPRKDATVTTIGCSIVLEQREQSRTSDHNIATDQKWIKQQWQFKRNMNLRMLS